MIRKIIFINYFSEFIHKVTLKRISVCDVIEKMMEHCIHSLPCFYTNDVIDLLPWQQWHHIDFKVTSLRCHCVNILIKTVGYSLVAMVTGLPVFRHLTYDLRGAWHK